MSFAFANMLDWPKLLSNITQLNCSNVFNNSLMSAADFSQTNRCQITFIDKSLGFFPTITSKKEDENKHEQGDIGRGSKTKFPTFFCQFQF